MWPEFRFTLPELQYPPSLNCAADLLDRHVLAGAGARRCIVTDTEEWSYADLLARSNQVAHALVHEMGLLPGNRVLLRGSNKPWLVASWFGVIKAGGVPVTTMPLLRSGGPQTMVEVAGVAISVCEQPLLPEPGSPTPDRLPNFKHRRGGPAGHT